MGLLLYAPLAHLSLAPYLAAVLLTVVVGTWAAERGEALFGRKDDRRITIDEVAGMLVSLIALPARPEVIASAFLLFRVFDVIKPQPARACERIPGGLGIMADDLVAGLYANLVGQVLWRILLPAGLA